MRLSQAAQDIIVRFEGLQIGNKSIRCPYFNNKRSGARAALRVLVGKGSAKEIEEETLIISLRQHTELNALDETQIRAFMIDNNLGIDCSAFAFYVLHAELKSNGKDIRSLVTPLAGGMVRKLIAKWRTVENINVKTLADDSNSSIVALADVKPGDIITMIGTGNAHDYDHVLVVEEVKDDVITYVHSLQWKADGKYGHGIKRGSITLTDKTKPLAKQRWTEAEKSGNENETFWRAETSEQLAVRRIQ